MPSLGGVLRLPLPGGVKRERPVKKAPMYYERILDEQFTLSRSYAKLSLVV